MTARRVALVTGASAGIGKAFAHVFAANGFDLVVTARREDRLQALASAIEQRHGVRVHVLPADLADPGAPAKLVEQLAARGLAIDALVNNAGYGVPGAFVRNEWQRHADFMQVLVMAVTELTYRLLPGMIERGYGRVINVASLAALVPAPAGHTLYAASKAFLVKFSEALSSVLHHQGVHVTAVCPGFTMSEFHDVTGTRAMMSRLPPFLWMDAGAVAQQGYDAVMAGRPVYVTGRVNRAIATLARMLPSGLVHSVNRRFSSNYRKA